MVGGWQELLLDVGVGGEMRSAIPETKLQTIAAPFNFLHPQVPNVGVDNRLL